MKLYLAITNKSQKSQKPLASLPYLHLDSMTRGCARSRSYSRWTFLGSCKCLAIWGHNET